MRTEPAAVTPESTRPLVVVLPFHNLSTDRSRTIFADGLVDDIITALSRFKSFAVIGRGSSFSYGGRALDIRQVAAELGVRYVLEGSVRRAGAAENFGVARRGAHGGANVGGPVRWVVDRGPFRII